MTSKAVILAGLGGALAGLTAATPALAHVAIEGASDFTAGLINPFFVLPHLLVIIGLGLFLAQQGVASTKLALAAFVAALLGGFAGAAVLNFIAIVPTRGILLATAVSVGLLVALNRNLPGAVAGILAAAAGLAIGVDSFPDGMTFWPALAGITGTSLSVSLVLVNVLAGAGYLTLGWQKIGMRVVGSWIGACALMVAALAMR
jgi:hydrogenase/urease accessory protein HupE